MKRFELVLVVLLLLSTITSFQLMSDHTEAQSETSIDEARTFVVNASIHSDYEQIVVDKIELEISGKFETLNELCYDKYSDGVISNYIENYQKGYGASKVSIDYIKTYTRIEDLVEVEANIPYGLVNAFNSNDNSKVVFVLYNYTNTAKSVYDQIMRLKNGLVGQYFVVSEFDDALYLTYIQFLGN